MQLGDTAGWTHGEEPGEAGWVRAISGGQSSLQTWAVPNQAVSGRLTEKKWGVPFWVCGWVLTTWEFPESSKSPGLLWAKHGGYTGWPGPAEDHPELLANPQKESPKAGWGLTAIGRLVQRALPQTHLTLCVLGIGVNVLFSVAGVCGCV